MNIPEWLGTFSYHNTWLWYRSIPTTNWCSWPRLVASYSLHV